MRDRTPPRDLALPPTAGHAADDNDDVIMAGSQTTTPLLPAMGRSHQSSSVSPGLQAQDTRLGPSQGSSVGSSSAEYHHHRHYSYGASPSSTVTSPAFGPRHSPHGGHYQHQPDANRVGSVPSSAPESTFTSPALAPQQPLRDLDQEASAALLMLNSDRRGSSGRGMSVRDLLST